MRIGLITGEYPPMQGGVADFTREIAVALAALGHTPLVLTGIAGVGREDAGVRIFPQVRNWQMAALRDIRAWARAQRVDVLNVQYQTAAYNMAGLMHFLPLLAGEVPVVVTFHDLRPPYLFPKAGPVRGWIVRHLARSAAAAIVTNAEDEAGLQQAGIAPVHRIPIGSNIAAAASAGYDRCAFRAGMGADADTFVIGYFGFMNRSKGVDALLAALYDLKQAGQPVKLVMIGGRTGASDPTNAAYANEIDILITRLGLTDEVLWTGFVESEAVSAYLYACDVCALPYRDGASLRRGSLMAALAHGLPVVTTMPTGPAPELIDGVAVRLVPPDDADKLAGVLETLAADSEQRAQLAGRAKRLAAQFAWPQIAARTADVFAQVCDQ